MAAPNLVEGRLPHRVCLACRRASIAASTARRRHGEVWTEARRKAEADTRYAEIMGYVEKCPCGHRRVAPNLRWNGQCLACARATGAASAARQRGELWTEDQHRAAGDAYYAKIMAEAAA